MGEFGLVIKGGVRRNKGRAPARGVALWHLSGALNSSHTLPRSPVSTNVTIAPASPDGQSLARRAAHLIPGLGALRRLLREAGGNT